MLIKTQFSIKDLENLTNVKAHTIRIWEKRYNLLSPERTDTNIRKYNLESLKRILNISFLYHSGYKISKIAEMSSREMANVIEKKRNDNRETLALQRFKTAMFEFDIQLFYRAYDDLMKNKPFEKIFEEVFIPLLADIGFLWQLGTIDPIHESFISESIKQKITVQIAQEQETAPTHDQVTFALFLPYEEVHDIGLMFANYKLIKSGFKTIYLGSSIPLKDLKNLLKHKEEIVFLTYLTLQPEGKGPHKFIKNFTATTCVQKECSLWVMGPKAAKLEPAKIPQHIHVIKNLPSFDKAIKELKKS